MSQLTPAFKLTLLLSIGVHLGAFLQAGGNSSGFHEQNMETRLNITLNALSSSTQTELQERDRPEKNPVEKRPIRKVIKTRTDQTQPKAVTLARQEPVPSTSPELQSGHIRQVTGAVQTGLFDEEQYRKLLLRHLEQYKHYPFVARRGHREGTATLEMILNPKGKLLTIKCLSGESLFCNAAIQSARNAEPLPAPPARSKSYAIQYAMVYRLRD
jgi:protein TonB